MLDCKELACNEKEIRRVKRTEKDKIFNCFIKIMKLLNPYKNRCKNKTIHKGVKKLFLHMVHL